MVRAVIGDADLARVYAELLGHHLRRDGFGTVAPERGKQGDGNTAGRANAYACALSSSREARGGSRVMEPELGRAVRAALLARSQANTDVAPLLASALLLLSPVVQVSVLQRHIQHRRIVPTVVNIARWHL